MSGVTGILLCAGSARRMGFNKLTVPLAGKSAMQRSMEALLAGGVDELICAVSDQTREHAQEITSNVRVPVTLVDGGQTRQESVYRALTHAKDAEIIVIHDAARCLVSPELVRTCISSARDTGSGIAAMPAQDTIVWLRKKEESIVLVTPPRDELTLTQTPQAFRASRILKAYEKAQDVKTIATDDCTIYASAGYLPCFVRSGPENRKLTTIADWQFVRSMLAQSHVQPAQAVLQYRVGHGEDVHRLVPDRPLVLGGVTIPYEKGLLGHSDADVLVHAIIDAMLGAAALGDIGKLFSDSDPKYKDISSLLLLQYAFLRVQAEGYSITNIDATITAEAPKLQPHIGDIRDRLATTLRLNRSAISVKATTSEGLGPEGRGESMRAQAVVLLARNV